MESSEGHTSIEVRLQAFLQTFPEFIIHCDRSQHIRKYMSFITPN